MLKGIVNNINEIKVLIYEMVVLSIAIDLSQEDKHFVIAGKIEDTEVIFDMNIKTRKAFVLTSKGKCYPIDRDYLGSVIKEFREKIDINLSF